jgi:DNA-binding transcriptional LysR family regulator
MRPLPSDLLRSFAAVAQTGSFTVASERVCLSQSTVSQQIRRLEDLIGQPLFERDTRNVRLSPHGEILLRYAQKILEMMDEAITELCGPPLNGAVRLALPEDFASTRLTTALASFVQRNPNVELVVSSGMSGDLFRELDEGRHDLVFAKRLSGSQRGVVVRTEPLVWCVGPTSAYTGTESILPLAVHSEPSVTRTRQRIRRICDPTRPRSSRPRTAGSRHTGLRHRSSTVGHTRGTGAGVGAPRGGAGIVTPALLA